MEAQTTNRYDDLNELVKQYLGSENIVALKQPQNSESLQADTKTHVSRELPLAPIVAAQLEYSSDNSPSFRVAAELSITKASEILCDEKFYQFLIDLGDLSVYSGEYSLATDIFEKIISETKSTKNEVTAAALMSLGDLYSRQGRWQFSLGYIKEASDLYKKLKNFKGVAKCENLIGTIYGDCGELTKANNHFINSLSYLENVDDDVLKGKIEVNLGIINNIKENFDAALSYFRRALIKFEKVSQQNRVAEIRHNMGMLFLKKGQYDYALIEFNRSIAISAATGYLQILGFSYLSKAFIYMKLSDYSLAEAFADKALEIGYQINDKLTIADTFKIKGMINTYFNNPKLAESYLLTSLRINKELGNKLNEAETNYQLGILYKDKKNGEKSRVHLREALHYFREIQARDEIKNVESAISAA